MPRTPAWLSPISVLGSMARRSACTAGSARGWRATFFGKGLGSGFGTDGSGGRTSSATAGGGAGSGGGATASPKVMQLSSTVASIPMQAQTRRTRHRSLKAERAIGVDMTKPFCPDRSPPSVTVRCLCTLCFWNVRMKTQLQKHFH